jgi:hypothetical protein
MDKGISPGFLVGQQMTYKKATSPGTFPYAPLDSNLSDRTGAPLIFTPAVKLTETGSDLERTGIRVMKYPIDYGSGDNSNNDYVYFRLADVLLMKAEAILRGGTGTTAGPYGSTALAIVNYIRTHASRGASNLASINLDQLLDERGRELYWEGWRRQDLVRFGKFLQAWQEKPASDPKRLLFPIPSRSLAANPNLVQNEGY